MGGSFHISPYVCPKLELHLFSFPKAGSFTPQFFLQVSGEGVELPAQRRGTGGSEIQGSSYLSMRILPRKKTHEVYSSTQFFGISWSISDILRLYLLYIRYSKMVWMVWGIFGPWWFIHQDEYLYYIPYDLCMVYLPTWLGDLFGQMLVNIPAPWSVWVYLC